MKVFQVGDKVVRTGGSFSEAVKGEHYIVRGVKESGDLYLSNLAGNAIGGSYDENNFDLVSAVEVSPADIAKSGNEIATAAMACLDLPKRIAELQKELDVAKATLLKFGLQPI